MKNRSTEKVETITPKLATDYLNLNLDRDLTNRGVRQSCVVKYASEMEDDLWRTDVNPIMFDVKGRLIDGQHRLLAIQLVDKPVDILVKRNVSEDSFKVLDGGLARDAVAFATIERRAKPAQAIPLFRWLQNVEKTDIPTLNPSQESKRTEYDLQEWGYLDHPHVLNAISVVSTLERVNKIPERVMQYCYYQFAKHDAKLAYDYLAYLVCMDGLAPCPTASYVKRHIMGFLQKARENSVYSRDLNEHLLVWVIAGWNAIRDGRTDLVKFKNEPAITREGFRVK